MTEALPEHFRDIPNVITDPRFHRGRHVDRPMNPTEIVVGEAAAPLFSFNALFRYYPSTRPWLAPV